MINKVIARYRYLQKAFEEEMKKVSCVNNYHLKLDTKSHLLQLNSKDICSINIFSNAKITCGGTFLSLSLFLEGKVRSCVIKSDPGLFRDCPPAPPPPPPSKKKKTIFIGSYQISLVPCVHSIPFWLALG